ncbi:hypothetical protein FFLO_06038 [Filobasidium floriforme]|uniref:Maintenance of telomere capping protein 1 n=1 Tax=Filobasidium floriforme TaxID=5210 RepID=A0A8K0JFP7_9TREE|nr:uncharacterized protein HD553DRAFT_340440 [Filobasidium floriforme]KAG7528615.1 hypothetical protein FFLO_06038 [Filobasidium floriforme]KAH8087278.1 hypothetical protein HD553DRAFT_340440 [Filobasidium floriforme]
MSKKSAKSKKEEALAFLDDLDKLGEEDSTETSSASLTADQGQTQAGSSEGKGKASMDIPRKSVDSSRSAVNPGAGTGTGMVPPAKGKGNKKALTGNASAATSNPSTTTSAGGPGSSSTSTDKTTTGTTNAHEEDPEAALAYLQAQIDQKNRPISRVQTPTTTSTPSIARPATPQNSATIGSILPAPTTTRKSIEQTRSRAGTPLNEPTSTTTSSDPNTTTTNSSSGGGWGFWSSALQTAKSTATSAYTQASQVASAAQSAALAQAEKSGVNLNVNDYVPVGADLKGLKGLQGLNLEELKKAGSGGLEALRTRVGEGVKGVDLERLRQDILAGTSHALTELINTVAPPISEHEVVQVWMTHRMKGYDGVESVVYQGVMKMMEQTSSSELEVFFLPSPSTSGHDQSERSINPLEGWEAGWAAVEKDLEGLKMRAGSDERKGEPNPDLPVTTVPIYLHLQPVLVPLPFAEPPSSKEKEGAPSVQPKHLTFIVTLHDDVHGLKQSTVTQYSPADWMDVEYERSDWVEERLVDVIRVGVEIVIQEYVAVRMGLKAKSTAEASEQKPPSSTTEDKETTEEKVAKEAGVGT